MSDMHVWTVANQKGGVGKTTTSVTLGGILAQAEKRVLLVDTDPQASLSYYFGIDSEELTASIYDVFIQAPDLTFDGIMDCLCSTKFDSLFILPATMNVATLDRTLGAKSGMGLVLTKALGLIAKEFDYVIIDCPPVLGVLMVNALAACDRVIIPVQTEYLALKGLDRMMHTLEIMSKTLSKQFNSIIVPTMYDKRTKAALEAYDKLKEDYGDQLWDHTVPIDTRFRDASQQQSPASLAYPKCRGVFAYKRLLKELEKNH